VPFPVEKAPTKKIPLAKSVLKSGVKVSKLRNFPVRGLVFERGNTLKDLADVVTNACIWLQDNNVPFNVLISDSGRRIFLFPQVISAAKSHTSFTLDHEHF
jgi:GDP-L-galactose phosphorylase